MVGSAGGNLERESWSVPLPSLLGTASLEGEREEEGENSRLLI